LGIPFKTYPKFNKRKSDHLQAELLRARNYTLNNLPLTGLKKCMDFSGTWRGNSSWYEKTQELAITIRLTQYEDQLEGTATTSRIDSRLKAVSIEVIGRITGDTITLFDVSVLRESESLIWCKKIYTLKILREGKQLAARGHSKNNGNQVFYSGTSMIVDDPENCTGGSIFLQRVIE
jgi:hypothetical protein